LSSRDVEDPAPHEAEDEYWKIVADKDVHMQVFYQDRTGQDRTGQDRTGQEDILINIQCFHDYYHFH